MVKSRQELTPPGTETGQPLSERAGDSIPSRYDEDGIPRTASVVDWLELADPRDARWLQAVIQFSRADGSSVFGSIGRDQARLKRLADWALRMGDPGLIGVVNRWLPHRLSKPLTPSPLPVPADSRPDRPLAILRGDWNAQAEILAIDHRQPGDATLLEVGSKGRTWLGATWTSGIGETKFARPRPTHSTSEPLVESVEWSYRAGSTRVIRTATLLRGRSLALLGQQVEGHHLVNQIRLKLADGVQALPIVGSRAILLSSGRGKPTVRLVPLGLPCHDRPTTSGSIAIEGREVVIRQVPEGRRSWLPVLVCWGKPPTTWRPLTISYRSRAIRSDLATAARVAWGPSDEGLVVYRSLGLPALRSFLGHQTGSRYLVGNFTRAGDLRPILKVDL
jgi:hypothetical protein